MRRSSSAVAVCAVAATVLAAAAGLPDPARASAANPLFAQGSDIASPRFGSLALRAAPDSGSVLARVGTRTVYGSPNRLAVVGASGEWLAVISAALGNRVRGYVPRTRVRLVHVQYSLEVDRSLRRLTVWRMGVPLRRLRVAIGAPATPTPSGRFSITDKLSNFWPSLYGCCVLALSGRQTHLPPGWSGGDRLAIHAGRGIGAPVSGGCLRASQVDMRFLMARLPLGTQVVIHP
jgi:lipoprotein-anchoring transpeptidase ErfK/SrfK